MRGDKRQFTKILTEWAHPEIMVRANINYSRAEIRKPGVIAQIRDTDTGKRFSAEFKSLDEIYKTLCGSFVQDFTVSVENPTVDESEYM